MEMEPAVPEQPALNLRCLMGGKVIEDDMNVELNGDFAVDLVQKCDEVVLVMAGPHIGDDGAASDIERREQINGAVALIVVRGSLRCGGQHGQCGGGAVQRLDLRFLVDCEHRRRVGRVHVQPGRGRGTP